MRHPFTKIQGEHFLREDSRRNDRIGKIDYTPLVNKKEDLYFQNFMQESNRLFIKLVLAPPLYFVVCFILTYFLLNWLGYDQI